MKVLLDSQIFSTQKFGGISRYYTEIFGFLSKRTEFNLEIPLFYSNNVYLIDSFLITENQKKQFFLYSMLSKFGISIRKKTKQYNLNKTIKSLKKQNFDLLVPTYYDTYFLTYLNSKPFVLTVYDMIHELFPELNLSDSKFINDKLVLMEKATKIIAVSNNTKKDIIKIYPHLDESKIEVIYHGSSIKINNNLKLKLPEKYVLFVGARSSYKNYNFLRNSMINLLKNDENLHLICAGGGKFNESEIKQNSELNLNNQIKQIDFHENELGLIYKNAICFVFPSLYEGFGIPVLESMACGCPIVLSEHSSFPEVAGEAGLYFETNNANDLEEKILSLIQNENLRTEYKLKGLKQVKKFNWEKASEQCLTVYKEAINSKKK